MTPGRAVLETDETGTRLATAYWQRQTGSTNTFDMSRPADTLTLRIALLAAARGEQNVIFPAIPHVGDLSVSNGVIALTLPHALCLAARNDRSYQRLKEAVFEAALDLDYQQYRFGTTFSGMMFGLLSGDPGIEKASGGVSAGAARRTEAGLAVAGNLALNVVSLLRDDWRSLGLTGDLSMTLPLLRGAGREIVREPLTQAERNLTVAIWSFDRYRQTYAYEVASAFYDVLEYAQRLRNAVENERRLSENSRRAEMWFEAGRMERIQVDQARSDLLNAGESVINTRKSMEAKLDAFKIQIGLPPEAKITLDDGELDTLEKEMEQLARRTSDAVGAFPEETEACRIALAERHDLLITRSALEDVARGVKIAADALRADLTLQGGASLDRLRETGGDGFDGGEALEGGLSASLPWDRRRERNAFKKRLIELEQAKRTLEAMEDTVKQAVRSGYRNLIAARASYENRQETMRVARLRLESNNLFLLSGRSSMRDILEAESAMLSARNALCSAMIQWRLSELALRRDMGVFEIAEDGMWHETADRGNHG
jgi:outer membrane protein TolC